MPETVLAATGVEAGYSNKQILFGVDFWIAEGEVVALLGANGSGKSTALNAVSGFVRPWAGSIRFGGSEISGAPPHEIFRRGIIQVSQSRDLFADMSVEENLRLGACVRRGDEAALLEGVYASFPRLAERRSQPVSLLSGGEQQMVALGRALMGRPRLLLMDEPSGGLAPAFVEEIAVIVRSLRERGTTMLLVEQNIRLALAVADRFLILREGRVSEHHDLRSRALDEADLVRSIYL
jgi:branched-chain amino acid transport system ATP-binding protein